MLRRLLCWLFGHREAPHSPGVVRCWNCGRRRERAAIGLNGRLLGEGEVIVVYCESCGATWWHPVNCRGKRDE
ncbi:MAG TPA: hypothetical protein VEA38_01580 [Terriglobales bacterium]|nr:hypothetical protein [Terriglobales bacterium]